MTSSLAFRARISALLLAVAAPLAAAAPAVLVVHDIDDSARLERDGDSRALVADQPLLQSDRLRAESRVMLTLGRYGQVELGQGAVMEIAKLPFSSYADNLATLLRLDGGYARVLWKHPQGAGVWPLAVEVDGHRVELGSGEFFFQAPGGLCVGVGDAVVAADASGPAATLEAPACYTFRDGVAVRAERSTDDFIAMRAARRIEGLEPAELPADKPAAAPAPESVAESVPALAPASAPAPAPESAPAPAPEPEVAETPAPEPEAAVAEKVEPTAPPSQEAAPVQQAEKGMPGQQAAEEAAPSQQAAAPEAAPEQATESQPLLEPATKPATPAPVAAGDWFVNIYSEPDAASAKADVKKLRSLGYEVTVLTAQVNGRQWYRVGIAGLADGAAARALATQVEAKLHYHGVWAMRLPALPPDPKAEAAH